MRPDLPQPTHRLEPRDTLAGILFLRLKAGHVSRSEGQSPERWPLCAAGSEGVAVQRDAHKHKFEVPEGLPVVKDLYGHPVVRRDGGHVASLVMSLKVAPNVPIL